MIKILKNNMKLIVGIIIGVILASTIAVYAVINANEIDYKNGKKVSQALDDLYSKIPSGTIPITTKENQIDVSQYQYADTTGLYTESELQAQTGKGKHWIKSNFTITNNGDFIVNCGFLPKTIYFFGSETDGTKSVIYYDGKDFIEYFSRENSTTDNLNSYFTITSTGFCCGNDKWTGYEGDTWEFLACDE